jgi:hypothetical protein
MPVIINGSKMPVNAIVSYNSQSVNKIVYRHICATCGGDGLIGNEPGSDIGVPCEVCSGSGFDVIDTVWTKLSIYTLTISQGAGVESVTVTRSSSKNPDAFIGVLASGAEIYAGDNLTVSAVASSGYDLDPFTSNYIVSENVNVNVTATIDLVVTAPTITLSYVESGFGDFKYREYTAKFTNPNNLNGTLYFSSDDGYRYDNVSITANGSFDYLVLVIFRGESASVLLKAYIEISGVVSNITSFSERIIW